MATAYICVRCSRCERMQSAGPKHVTMIDGKPVCRQCQKERPR